MNNRAPHLCAGLALTLASGACAVSNDEGVEDTQSVAEPITGGTVAAPDDLVAASVVRLMQKVDSPTPFCTGTIIDYNHVLTAGHCGGFGGTYVALFFGERIAVKQAFLYPTPDVGHDVAVLELASTIPSRYRWINVPFAIKTGSSATVAGYAGTNTLKWRSTFIRSQSGNDVRSGSTEFTEPGDSGGPLFVPSSAGGFDLVGSLRGGDGYMNLPYYRDFIVGARAGGGQYTDADMVFSNSGKCLDVPGRSSASGVQLQQYDCNGTSAQRFAQLSTAYLGITRQIRNESSRLCLDVDSPPGAWPIVVQRPCNNSDSQVWEFWGGGPGQNGAWDWSSPTAQLRQKTTGLCMTTQGWSSATGAKVLLYTCSDGRAASRIQFKPVR